MLAKCEMPLKGTLCNSNSTSNSADQEGESEKRRARQERIELQSASVSSNLIAFSFRFFTATSIISVSGEGICEEWHNYTNGNGARGEGQRSACFVPEHKTKDRAGGERKVLSRVCRRQVPSS